MPRSQPVRAAPAAAPTSAVLPAVLLLLAGVGLAIAVRLTVLHWQAHSGLTSGCAISERVNCDTVALSSWSVLLGVPLAAWGALAYLAVGFLAALGLRRDRPGPGFPGGLLVLVTGFMTAVAVALAFISELIIKSLCLYCLASWITSLLLLVGAIVLARRAGGVGAALRSDLGQLRARPAPFAAAAAALLALAVALLVGYRLAPPPDLVAKQPASGSPAHKPAAPGSQVVYEFSDYQCPWCARMHMQLKPLLARRPDIRMVRRHYPLDNTCNPLLSRQLHEGSCDMARAAICAEASNRFEALDDLLFGNLEAKVPLDVLLQRAGLDVAATRACMASPATEQRLKADIADGTAAGVRSTPSYAHQGRLYGGELPPVFAEQ
ncbi:MAG: vitamin K epoxide reductase family protein [Anaeromyxobacter sp.]